MYRWVQNMHTCILNWLNFEGFKIFCVLLPLMKVASASKGLRVSKEFRPTKPFGVYDKLGYCWGYADNIQ